MPVGQAVAKVGVVQLLPKREPTQTRTPARLARPVLPYRAAAPRRACRFAAVIVVVDAGHALRAHDARVQDACHVGPVGPGLLIARIRFWELLREPCSVQVAWNGFKCNEFMNSVDAAGSFFHTATA